MPKDESTIKDFNKIQSGDHYTLIFHVTEELVERFASLTGDYNPLHMDACFAQKTSFGGRVAHGMLSGSFVSTIIGMHLPGPGSLWLSQNFEFLAPVKIGDTVEICATVIQKSESQGIIIIEVEGKTKKGIVVLHGEGKVKIMREEKLMHRELKECKVLVTGASRGLGAMIALKFTENGSAVFLNYRNSKDKAEEVKRKAKGLSGTIELIQGDITTEEGIKHALSMIGQQGIDIVIFNAVGDLKQALFLEQSLEDFERALDYGMRSPVHILQHLLPHMVKQNYGRIVSVLSTYSCGAPVAGFSSYVLNKKALESITKSIAVEYGKYNICANMVSPNMLRTDLTADTTERAKQLLEAQTPLKRLASLEEVASSVVFLCSPQASYINGHNLIVSGGSMIL